MNNTQINAADMFCGCGGTSTGLARAAARLGLLVQLVAVNHWEMAIATHRANHPHVHHLCESLGDVDPREAVPEGRLKLLVASPECTHFSVARGGKPMDDQSRHGARHIIRWADALDIESILIENVREFRTWGPLGPDLRPIKERKGEYFEAFLSDLRARGYTVEHRILCAADYGDPTTRERLFIIATKRSAIAWPEPTHGDPKRLAGSLFSAGLKPWRTARECIDWKIVSKSIFTRKKPLAEKTLLRTYIGLQKHGGPNAWLYLAMLSHYMESLGIEPPSAATGRSAPPAGHSSTDPASLVVLRNHLENASLDTPMPTVCAGGQHIGLAESVILEHPRPKGDGVRSPSEPFGTVTATSSDFAIAEPIVPNFGERPGQTPRSHALGEPLPTVTGHGAGAIAEPFILPHRKFKQMDADSADAPLRTVDATNGGMIGVVDPIVIRYQGGETPGQWERTQPTDDPLTTLDCSNRFAVVEPSIVNLKGQSTASSIDAPAPTQTASGHQYLADSCIVELTHGNGTEDPAKAAARRSRSIDEPLGTLTTAKRGEKAIVDPVIIEYYGNSHPDGVESPLGTVTTKQRFALVTCEVMLPGEASFETFRYGLMDESGELAYLLDIRLRMLRPHELAAAHSIPDYQLHGNLEQQVRQIGNMVPAAIAEALCYAVLSNEAELERRSA